MLRYNTCSIIHEHNNVIRTMLLVITQRFDRQDGNIDSNNNRINSLRQICTIIRAISLPNKEHMEN